MTWKSQKERMKSCTMISHQMWYPNPIMPSLARQQPWYRCAGEREKCVKKILHHTIHEFLFLSFLADVTTLHPILPIPLSLSNGPFHSASLHFITVPLSQRMSFILEYKSYSLDCTNTPLASSSAHRSQAPSDWVINRAVAFTLMTSTVLLDAMLVIIMITRFLSEAHIHNIGSLILAQWAPFPKKIH